MPITGAIDGFLTSRPVATPDGERVILGAGGYRRPRNAPSPLLHGSDESGIMLRVKPILARAPVRIDLAGGTLDIWPLNLALPEPAVTVNVALDLPAQAQVAEGPEGGPEIRSAAATSTGGPCTTTSTRCTPRSRTAASPLMLLARAVLAVAPSTGVTLMTDAGSPPGAGLGGSSALLCAVLGALSAGLDRATDARALQALAQDVETRLLRTPTGYQDYYPPLLGGCLALEGGVGGTTIERLDVDLPALAARLRLVYTGVPHDSGITNWGVLRAYFDGEPTRSRPCTSSPPRAVVSARRSARGISRQRSGA